jgi:hypothetical protein
MPPSRDSFRRNRVAPVDDSILALFARGQAWLIGTSKMNRFRLSIEDSWASDEQAMRSDIHG